MASQATQPKLGDEHDGIIRRSFGIAVRSVDKESRTVEVIASTTSLDSHGDIVEQDWDLERYSKNPVVLWNHNRSGGYSGSSNPADYKPIGHSTKHDVEAGQLIATLKLGSREYSQLADEIFLGFVEGHIRAVSVGFRAGKITEELHDGLTRYRLSKCELYEISVVPIGSNPDAVAKSIEADHQYFRRMVAGKQTAPRAEETARMDIDQVKATHATELKTLQDKHDVIAKQLRDDLAAANDRAKAAETLLAKTELDALQGKKFAPAERAKFDKLVSQIGIDEVKSLLADRADLSVTQPVEIEGKTLGTTQPAAPAVTPDAQKADDDFNKAVADDIKNNAA